MGTGDNEIEGDADFSQLEGAVNDDKGTEEPGIANSVEAELKREVDEFRDKYLRALAETENVRKRAIKERSDLLKYQGERLIIDLMDVVDNFEHALANPGSDLEKFKEGVTLIQRKLNDVLSKWEVKAESGVGQNFDPVKYEAISRVPVDDAPPGTIINELKKAVYYKDKLIRPGVVVVVAEKEPAPGEGASDESDSDDEGGEDEG